MNKGRRWVCVVIRADVVGVELLRCCTHQLPEDGTLRTVRLASAAHERADMHSSILDAASITWDGTIIVSTHDLGEFCSTRRIQHRTLQRYGLFPL